ncbi:BspA family leucine-rich repeat surface protein [Marivirga sp.]|uniref:BspA family leucine-rich repeat surface protein n=1 Tax=Marivirga sp. TaxID=2018662 RepID=UPI003DA74A23
MNNLMRRHFIGGKKLVDPTSTVFEVETNSPDQTFEITLFLDGNYNFEVDWGDGSINTITTYNDANLIHNYSNTGNYDVVLTGTVNGIKILNQPRIKYIKQWGSALNWAGFENCGLLEDLSTDIPQSFRNNSMASFFLNSTSFTGGVNMNNWNVSGITEFTQCFRDTSFNSNINNWDVSSASKLDIMFFGTPFNQPLNNWDVSNCIDFRAMFHSCPDFNQDITAWTFNSVTNFTLAEMFISANSFNQDISTWDVSNCNNMSYMFQNNTIFNQDISTWNVSSVTTMRSMFQGSVFNIDISSWNVSGVTNMQDMFRASQYNKPLNTWNVSNVTTMSAMFFQSQFNQPLNSWVTSACNNMQSMFRSCPFNQDISTWNVSSLINGFGMFQDNTLFNQDLSNWSTGVLNDTRNMFRNTSANFNASSWVVQNLSFADNMFLDSDLSTSNYDALLVGWESQKPNLEQGVLLGLGTTQYTAGSEAETARANLTDPAQFNWTITDGGAI